MSGRGEPRQEVVAVREIGAPGEIVRRYRGESLARTRDQIRGRESVQLGVTGGARLSALPELSNSPTITG
jgi:hypothetical protein